MKRSQLSWSDNSDRMQNHWSLHLTPSRRHYTRALLRTWPWSACPWTCLRTNSHLSPATYLQCNANNAQLRQVNNTQVQYWLFLLPLRLVSCPLAWCCRHNVRISLKEVPWTKKIGKVAGCGTKEKSFQLKLRRMATENSITRFHGVSIVRSSDFNAGPRKVSRRFLYFTN